MIAVPVSSSGFLFLFLFLKDFNRHVVDGGVIENYNATVGTWFDVDTAVIAEFVI